MTDQTDKHRPIGAAMLSGARRTCPNCGQGRMFDGYLSVRNECDICGQEFHHHRADDMHPWMTILIVGHLIGPMILAVEKAYSPADWVHMTLWPAMVIILSLLILPLAKGAVIALQWALRLHGFSSET